MPRMAWRCVAILGCAGGVVLYLLLLAEEYRSFFLGVLDTIWGACTAGARSWGLGQT